MGFLRFGWITWMTALMSLSSLWGCGNETSKGDDLAETSALRDIRAHSIDLSSVGHAYPPLQGERYCALCHGANLVGGAGLIPSCYQCHGQLWQTLDGSLSRAPDTHQVDRMGYLHLVGAEAPETNCAGCHGSELQGDTQLGTPSCLLCHARLWP